MTPSPCVSCGTASVIRGNALALPLPDRSVDLVVTSPPYYGLRSYQDGGEHYDGQLGAELTPTEYLDGLLEATREMVRVLKPSGSIWVNLGDKYSGNTGSSGYSDKSTLSGFTNVNTKVRRMSLQGARRLVCDAPTKSLIGIPWRYALRCIDEIGLILRAEVIWSKPNGLPESVQDRVRRSHEQWFWFQQSGGVEAAAERFPFCPLCGRPVDAKTSLVKRLQEVDRSVESVSVPDEMRTNVGVEPQDARGRHHDVAVGTGGATVPPFKEGDIKRGQDGAALVENGVTAVIDRDSQDGSALASDQRDGALSVDDASEPTAVCECVGHPLIINEEPWIPQSLAADVMQRVADGEIDPQQAADFLSGDYVRTHSVWFHFTVQPRYFSAVDEIREEYQLSTISRNRYTHHGHTPTDYVDVTRGVLREGRPAGHEVNPLGKLPGSVWEVATQPLKVPDHVGVDHFAAFPMEWPRRIIRGWSPSGICVECGEGRRPVTHRKPMEWRPGPKAGGYENNTTRTVVSGTMLAAAETTIVGHACSCPESTADTRPAVVLDPFGGTGTTALVAKVLGRHGISVDMSADYCRLARWRISDPGELARAMQVEKPQKQIEGQGVLL